MDRRGACLAQEAACLEKADADRAHRERWIEEAAKWRQRAEAPCDHMAVTFEAKDGSPLPKP